MSSDHFTPVGCLDIGDETLPKLYYGDYKGLVSTASGVQVTNVYSAWRIIPGLVVNNQGEFSSPKDRLVEPLPNGRTLWLITTYKSWDDPFVLFPRCISDSLVHTNVPPLISSSLTSLNTLRQTNIAWEIHRLKMYLLLKMVVFHCYVSLLEGILTKKSTIRKSSLKWRIFLCKRGVCERGTWQ